MNCVASNLFKYRFRYYEIQRALEKLSKEKNFSEREYFIYCFHYLANNRKKIFYVLTWISFNSFRKVINDLSQLKQEIPKMYSMIMKTENGRKFFELAKFTKSSYIPPIRTQGKSVSDFFNSNS